MEYDESRFVLERKARLQLQQLIADGNTPQKIVKRARIIVMTADGHGVMAIMREVGVSKTTVWRWQEYFAEAGVEGLVTEHALKPHLVKSFKVSTDPNFVSLRSRTSSAFTSGEGACAGHRREKPNSSTRPDPAGPA